LFRAEDNAKLTINGIDINAENTILTSSLGGGESRICIYGGYANIKNVVLGTFRDGNELNLKNVTLEIKDNIIYHASGIANFIIEDCIIYIVNTEENAGYPLSIRNANSSMYFVNNTVICKENNFNFLIYNGEEDVCNNFIFANNVIQGFSELVHEDATLVKSHNNYKIA
jgi:hypothetical protein